MNKSNWQRNFRRIPAAILQKLSMTPQNEIIVASVKRIPASVLKSGAFGHLGMSMNGDVPVFPERITPQPSFGRFSQWNVQGREIIRKDLPMVTKTFTVEVPDWGDWSNGSHDVYWNRDIYQREFIPPKEADISIALLATEPGDDPVFIFRFSVEEFLKK